MGPTQWLNRIWVRDQVHDGAKMTGWAYRMPVLPMFAGAANTTLPPDQYDPPIETEIITKLGVRAIITAPPRCHTTDSTTIDVEGRAWSGAGNVTRVEVSASLCICLQFCSNPDTSLAFSFIEPRVCV